MCSKAFHSTDWENVITGISTNSLSFKLFSVKNLSRFCATVCMMFLIWILPSGQFPCCKMDEETTYHLPIYIYLEMEHALENGTRNLQLKL